MAVQHRAAQVIPVSVQIQEAGDLTTFSEMHVGSMRETQMLGYTEVMLTEQREL
jgi:hypothetical protein